MSIRYRTLAGTMIVGAVLGVAMVLLVHTLLSGELQLLINTPLGKHAQHDDYEIRRAAVARGVPYTTTLSAASAAADAITALRSRALSVCSLQDREKRRETVRAELRASAGERVPT